MAVPGAFTPVQRDGRVLVDGGLVNNIPVDVVKAMGADVVIAVDVGAPSKEQEADRADTLGDILANTYTIMQRPKQLAQLEHAQIVIQPATAAFSASEFHRAAEIIPLGQVAARALRDTLAGYAVSEAAFQDYLARQRRALPPAPEISKITVNGCDRVDEKLLRNRIFSKVGTRLAKDTVVRDLRRMYGLGEFAQIQYHIGPEPDGRAELVYDVKEKPWGPAYLKLGLNLRSDFDNDTRWGILFNLTRRSLNRLGAEWKNELQLGDQQRVFTEFYQPVDARGFFFVAPSVEYENRIENLYDGDDKIAEYDVESLMARLDLGVQLRHYAELRVGPVWGHGKGEVGTGASDLPELDEDLGGLSVRLTSDRLDRSVFPRGGFRVRIEYTGAREDLGGDRTYDKLYGYYKHFISWSDHTVSLGLTGGTSLGTDLPEYDRFKLGGPFLFAGMAEGQVRGDFLGVASLGYRYRLARLPPSLGQAAYALARVDVGNAWQEAGDVGTDDLIVGGLIGLGVDTLAGPVVLGYGQAEGGFSSFYFSLGTSF
jgi:NTE family protein